MARDWGYQVSERRITIDEVVAAGKSGALKESFGTGTAAVISPVGEFCYQEQHFQINGGEAGGLAKRLYDELQAIQFGYQEDPP